MASVYPESITTPIILNLINEKNRELEIETEQVMYNHIKVERVHL